MSQERMRFPIQPRDRRLSAGSHAVHPTGQERGKMRGPKVIPSAGASRKPEREDKHREK